MHWLLKTFQALIRIPIPLAISPNFNKLAMTFAGNYNNKTITGFRVLLSFAMAQLLRPLPYWYVDIGVGCQTWSEAVREDVTYATCSHTGKTFPDSKVHGVNMRPIWGRQDPGVPHVGPINFVILVTQWNITIESMSALINDRLGDTIIIKTWVYFPIWKHGCTLSPLFLYDGLVQRLLIRDNKQCCKSVSWNNYTQTVVKE